MADVNNLTVALAMVPVMSLQAHVVLEVNVWRLLPRRLVPQIALLVAGLNGGVLGAGSVDEANEFARAYPQPTAALSPRRRR